MPTRWSLRRATGLEVDVAVTLRKVLDMVRRDLARSRPGSARSRTTGSSSARRRLLEAWFDSASSPATVDARDTND